VLSGVWAHDLIQRQADHILVSHAAASDPRNTQLILIHLQLAAIRVEQELVVVRVVAPVGSARLCAHGQMRFR
jgi:hypothetical protein